MPLISVIIPTYNGERFLAQALSSVCEQGCIDDIECIVVDDGSTDGTPAVLNQFSEKLPLVVVKKESDRGWVSSCNLALQKAKGLFSCFLHQDDIWLPGRLVLLREFINQFPDMDCFFTAAQFIDGKGARLGAWAPRWEALPHISANEVLLSCLLVQNVIAIPAPLFRTSVAKKIGGLDEALWYTADWDFWLKLVAENKVGYCVEETVGFRVHQQAQTVTRSGDVRDFYAQMMTVFLRHAVYLPENDVYRRAAQFSVVVNTTLAALLHRNWSWLRVLVCGRYWLDWKMLKVFVCNACFFQRVYARIVERIRRK